MNETLRANMGYSDERILAQDPTEIEYLALARITHSIKSSFDTRNQSFSRYIESLAKNLEFWSILAIDVLEKDNRLPLELRNQVFWLFQYVTKETKTLMRNSKGGNPSSLIEINISLMQGLRIQKE